MRERWKDVQQLPRLQIWLKSLEKLPLNWY